MPSSSTPANVALTELPAWKALSAHYEQFRNVHLRKLFADDPKRGESLAVTAEGFYFDYSKHRVTDETMRLLIAAGRTNPACAIASTRCFAATRSTSPKSAPCCMSRCAPRAMRRSWSTGRMSCRKSTQVLDRMADFSDRVRSGAWTGHTGKPHPQRDQYRHRRLRPRPRDGVRSAAPLQRSHAHVPLRLERRWHRFRRGDARPRSGRDAVHHFVEDLHHARDHDQCAYGARLEPGAR